MWVRNFWHMLVSNMGNTGFLFAGFIIHPPCLLISKLLFKRTSLRVKSLRARVIHTIPQLFRLSCRSFLFLLKPHFYRLNRTYVSLEAVLRPFTSSAIQSQALWGQSGPSTVGPSSNFLRNQPLYLMIHPENQKGQRKIAQALTPDSKRYFLVATKRPFFATAYT